MNFLKIELLRIIVFKNWYFFWGADFLLSCLKVYNISYLSSELTYLFETFRLCELSTFFFIFEIKLNIFGKKKQDLILFIRYYYSFNKKKNSY